MTDSYQQQLLSKDHENNLKLRQIISEKDDEVQKAKQKVCTLDN